MTDIPQHPRDLGFTGARFENGWREQQVTALRSILESDKKFVIIQAPPGSGKSLVAAALPQLTHEKAVYTCTTVALQNQVGEEFKKIGNGRDYARILKGRRHYPTLNYPDEPISEVNAGDCTSDPTAGTHCRMCCRGCPEGATGCAWFKMCPYIVARELAQNSMFAVLNTHMYLMMANYTRYFQQNPWLIMDEADTVENALLGMLQVTDKKLRKWEETVTKLAFGKNLKGDEFDKALAGVVKAVRPGEVKDLDGLREWCRNIRDYVSAQQVGEEIFRPETNEDDPLKEEYNELFNSASVFLNDLSDDGWLVEPDDEGGLKAKPVWAARYAQRHIWRYAERVVLMSGSITSPDVFCRTMGIPEDEYEYVDLGSDFPAERRPVFYVPTARVTMRNADAAWPRIVEQIDRIIERHPNEKVIVHSVAYKYAERIYRESEYSHLMAVFDNSHRFREVIQEFRRAGPPWILVGPGFERGVDLPDDLCRVIIIPKVPWPNRGDEQIRARIADAAQQGRKWETSETISRIIQMTGRGMRSKADYCATYILDTTFAGIMGSEMWPDWWNEALTEELPV